MGLLNVATRAAVEGFSANNSSDRRRDAYVEFVAFLLAFIIALVIIGFLGKWLWNEVVVDLFSFAKPARSLWQIVGLMFFLSLVHP
jgi:hypothetical protein